MLVGFGYRVLKIILESKDDPGKVIKKISELEEAESQRVKENGVIELITEQHEEMVDVGIS